MIIAAMVACTLLVGALGLLVPVLLRPNPSTALSRSSVNIAIAREREQELRRDLDQGSLSDAEYDLARSDLEATLLIDLADDQTPMADRAPARLSATLIALLLPLGAFGLYFLLGNPAALDPQQSPGGTTVSTPGNTPTDINTLLTELKDKLAERPDDIRGWILLANALVGTGRFSEAVPVYRRLRELQPGDAETLVRLADALAMTNNGSLTGEPAALLIEALALDPDQPQGLWLSGIAAQERGDLRQALTFWRRLEPLVGQEPEILHEVRGLINRASAALQDAPDTQQAVVRVNISVAPELLATISAEDTLFVYARVPDGPPMPVAALKLPALPLPKEIILDDRAMVMTTGSLSEYPLLEVGAHISHSGSPSKSPGDLLGSTDAFRPEEQSSVAVLIDQRLP